MSISNFVVLVEPNNYTMVCIVDVRIEQKLFYAIFKRLFWRADRCLTQAGKKFILLLQYL